MSQAVPHQAVRYVAVGLVVYLADYAAYAAIVHGTPGAFLLANVIGKLLGAALGFVLHRRFTFSWEQRTSLMQQALSYTGLLLFNLLLSSGLLWLVVVQAGVNALIGRILVDMCVVATSFVGMRLWVYRSA